MPNKETVRALISAFNVHNYFSNTVETNFTLQSRGRKDCIIVSFDKGMRGYQCREYLDNIKRKIIGEFYGIKEGDTDEVVLNTAKLIFDVKSFPFNIYKGFLSLGKHGGFEFVAPIDQGVIFNLKSHLASSLKKDVLEDMRVSSATIAFKKKKYLWHDEFDNKELCKQFEREFLSRMKNRYGCRNGFKNPLKIEGNSVYIKNVFDDIHFVDSVTQYKAWLTGMDLGVSNDVDHRVKSFKNMIIRSTYSMTEVMIDGFILSPPLNGRVVSILTPIIQNGKGIELLTKEDARAINHAFNNTVLANINGKTQAKLSVNGSSEVYGIDFSNKEISHCVITKIIESSVINATHELSIDPEFSLRALSPAQSPFNSPTYAGPSGLRTPPNQEKDDEGYHSNSPQKPKDSGSSSGGPGPSTMKWKSLTHLQDVSILRLPNGRLDEAQSTQLRSPMGKSQDGVLKDPLPRLNSIAVSYGVTGQSRDLGSAQTVCRPSSLKGAQAGANISKKEEELIKALLYWFNLNNYALDPPHTNFIAENGKIASLIDDGVDVKEYLQEIIDKTKEEYRVNKEEAYDLNEFPFQFLSNCEKNQETTVVANISRGALLNLKELFSREHEGKVEIKDIDINIVEKAVKSEKNKWVNFQVQEHGLSPKKAIKTCYPDESVLEYISITKDKGGYWMPAKGTRNTTTTFKKIEESKKDDSSSGYSSGFVTDAENVSSKAEATTSSYESIGCENTRERLPKRKSPESLAGSRATKKTRSESDSSSFEGGVGSPRPSFSGPTIEQVREQLNKTGISK